MRYTLFLRGRACGHRRSRVRRSQGLRAGGMKRRLLVVLLLLLVVVALLPTIVAKTPLADMVLARAMPNDDVQVSIGSLSLGWLSPPSAAAVEVKDAAGATLLTAESIRLDRSIWALATDRSDLGTIEVVRPVVYVAVRPDGSNVEDVLAQLTTTDEDEAAGQPTTSAPTVLKVSVVEGLVRMRDMADGREWRIEGLAAQYDTSATGAARLAATGRIGAVGVDQPGAPMAGGFKMTLAPDQTGREQLAWETSGVPLSAAEPWLRRAVAGAELAGLVSGQGTASWTDTTSTIPADLATSGQVAIDRLDATAPALGGDRVRLVRVEMPWRLVADPRGLAIEELTLRSDVGQVAARGIIDTSAIGRTAWAGGDDRHDVEMRASVDVARLAAMLPHALRIRADTTITSGVVQLSLRQRPIGGGQTLAGTLRTTQLAATSAGRQFRWDQPVNADFTLRRQDGALRLDALNCNSDFLTVSATGTPTDATARAQFDLNKLADQLGQFVDLRGVELAGTGTAEVAWRAGSSATPAGAGNRPAHASNEFSVTASGNLAQLRVTLANGTVWSEPQLTLQAAATGAVDLSSLQPTHLATGSLHVAGQDDELNARLTGPVDWTAAAPACPLSISVTGNVARWLIRARPWFAPGEWQLDGQGELSATLRIAADAIDATSARLVVTNLAATSPGWRISEPRVELSGDMHWDGAAGRLAAGQAQLVSSAVALAAKDIDVRTGAGRVAQLTGVAAFRADLARLATWRQTPGQAPPWHTAGAVTGNLQVSQQGDLITGQLNATGQNLVLSEWLPADATQRAGYKTRWLEPELTVRGSTDYQTSADRLVLRQFGVQSTTLQAAIDGQVDQLTTAAEVNLTGTLDYDLAQVSQLLAPLLGNSIRLTGREQGRFAVAGPMMTSSGTGFRNADLQLSAATPNPQSAVRHPQLVSWSRQVKARLELPWSAANVYGLPVGAGRVQAALADGLVRVEPLALAVGEGQITATPTVRLDPEPAELSLPAGPLVTNVRISPEVSEQMLKYVAPVLAGATRCDGLFSMQLAGARVPLGEAREADVAGQLTVHSVQVTPGPLAQQWVGLAQQIEALAKRRDPAALANRPQATLLSIRDQQVDFRVADGRVYHQGMEFQAGDVVLHSQGSVGFDETLQLTLFVPIQDDWVAREPLLAGLKGQSLQIPITGTLSRPRMDQRAVANLSQQLIKSAAGQAIGNELNNALDKLFKQR